MLFNIAGLAPLVHRARVRYLLLCGGMFIGLVLAAGAALLVVSLRRDAVEESARDLKNLALVLDEEIDRSFQTVQLAQNALIEHMRELGIDTPEKFDSRMASLEINQNLNDRIAGLPSADVLMLIDRHGRILNLSHFWPVPDIDVHDRDYFRALNEDPSITSVVSTPFRNRGDGSWVIFYGRRFIGADGQFIGIVGSGIRLSYFEALFSRIMVSDDATFALYREDGIMLARNPHREADVGRPYGAPGTFERLVAARSGQIVRRPGLIDGLDRLIAPQRTAHFPLIVVATDTVQSALAGWRSAKLTLIGGAALLELVIAAIVLLGIRHLRGYERLHAANAAQLEAEASLAIAESELTLSQERERAADELRAQAVLLDTALNNMGHGLCMFDDASRIVVANRRFSELFDLPDGAIVPGMTYDEVAQQIIAAGAIKRAGMNALNGRRSELVAARSRATLHWELANGRTLMITHQPMASGWLSTYEDITERRKAEAQITHMANHDALTDLPNRVLFRERLEQAVVRARRGKGLALLCLDLDQFKAVNDTLGHPIGDALLKAVAARLVGQSRDIDMVARLGGDEFAIVQTELESPTDATRSAQRLINLLGTPFQVGGHQIVIGTSIGIAFAPQDGMDPDQLLRSADLALCRAKLDGRGICRLFHAEMDAQMQARRLLELDLRHAVRAGQLELFYQPQIDLRTKAVSGFEALLRWRHPERGLIPPIQFIPLAEEIGLIVPIGEWVLGEACAAAVSWPGNMRIAVNLSPVQFKSRNLVAAVVQALEVSGLRSDRLELEITETVMLQDTDATLAILRQFQELGVRIAMDDFGTGYSSLSYLRRFPFDRIKIDQTFVRDLCTKKDCIAIVRAVTTLGCDLGMATTAEGVETREQLDALAQAGCNEVQGYFFSPAVPGAAVPELLRTMADKLRPTVLLAVPEPVA